MTDGLSAWRRALADLHKDQRRGRHRRKPEQPGPGMIRRPAQSEPPKSVPPMTALPPTAAETIAMTTGPGQEGGEGE